MSLESDWYDNTEEAKQRRRDAADRFLEAVLNDPNHLGVSGVENMEKARKRFEELGMPLPKDVTIICVEPDTRSRANVVVFVLEPRRTSEADAPQTEAMETEAPLWRERWLASWPPY